MDQLMKSKNICRFNYKGPLCLVIHAVTSLPLGFDHLVKVGRPWPPHHQGRLLVLQYRAANRQVPV